MEYILDYLTGSLSSSLSNLIVYPLDYIKMKQILKDDTKSKSLYSGAEIEILGSFLVNGVHFGILQQFKKIIDQNTIIGKFKAILLVSLITTVLTNPQKTLTLEMIKEEKQNAIQKIKEIYNKDGIKGFYKGIIMSIILIINPVISYIVYETLKKQKLGGLKIKAFIYLLSGAISKSIATIITYPLFVIRAKKQQHNLKYAEILKMIYLQQGIISFYSGKNINLKGLQIKLFSSALESSFQNLFQEKIRKFFKQYLKQIQNK